MSLKIAPVSPDFVAAMRRGSGKASRFRTGAANRECDLRAEAQLTELGKTILADCDAHMTANFAVEPC